MKTTARSMPGAVALAALALAALAGCRQTPAQQPGDEVSTAERPAVLLGYSTAARQQLERVISDALNGAPVTLGDDAFTRDSELAIERSNMRDVFGSPAQGREMGRPELFKLVKQGSSCVLVHEGTGRRWVLGWAKCRPAG